jgi:hypothetical protein
MKTKVQLTNEFLDGPITHVSTVTSIDGTQYSLQQLLNIHTNTPRTDRHNRKCRISRLGNMSQTQYIRVHSLQLAAELVRVGNFQIRRQGLTVLDCRR